MYTQFWCPLLPLLCSLLLPVIGVTGATYECTIEKRHDESVCVFRDVVYRAGDTNIGFKASTSSEKVHHVAFERSTLEDLPRQLLSAFPDLKALTVVDANLSSVVIPAKLERLYASNNRISRVIVHQTKEITSMLELMLDSNHLRDISNLTRLAKLEILTLSGNKELPVDDTVDLGRFKGLNALRHLVLSDVGMLYVENEKNVALPALELLDLSNNDLITTNLRTQVFAPLKELQILRLAHTAISDLDVMQLTNGNSRLKEVYLEGSNFNCDLQQRIVQHLHDAGIATPVTNKNAPCMLGFVKQNDMCCKSAGLNALSGIVEAAKSRPPTPSVDTSDEGETRTTPRWSSATQTAPPPVTRIATSTTVAPKVESNGNNVEGGKGAATMISLGNGLLSLWATFTIASKLLPAAMY